MTFVFVTAGDFHLLVTASLSGIGAISIVGQATSGQEKYILRSISVTYQKTMLKAIGFMTY